MVFADFLTYEERLAMFTASFHAGGIFIIYADFIHDHKDKYFLLVIEAEVSTFFIINSEIPRIIARNLRGNLNKATLERVKVSVEKDIRMSFSQKMPILQSLKAALSNQ